ncbi:AAA family ATPase [Clostridium intestinale]|uniref:AAA family ATPase n=1 Tax=Clostridium intestinale TaxID=36845 RepID=UPI0028E9A6D1|nr:AAA family ATPase [Clostridium intestinale]
MELLYMYIKKFDDFIVNQSITFTNNYRVTLNNGILRVRKKKKLLDIYNKNIKNITLFVGKNGTGKTTILDIIGMNRHDRLKNSSSRNDEYFILYYLYKNNEEKDIYGIEYMGDSIFENVIKNCEIGSYSDYNKSKKAIGIQFKYDGNKFIDIDNHFFSNLNTDTDSLAEYINVVYQTENYSGRISLGRRITKEYETYMAPRRYYHQVDESVKYSTLNDINNSSSIEFLNKSVTLKIKDGLNYDKYKFDSLRIYSEIIGNIEKRLGFYEQPIRLFNVNQHNKKGNAGKRKERYILSLLLRYIVIKFIDVCIAVEDNKNNPKDYDLPKLESKLINTNEDNKIEFIEKIDDIYGSYFELGQPTDLGVECENLYMVIDYLNEKYKDKSFKKEYKKLLLISRYISSRLEAHYDFGKFGLFQKAIEEFIGQFLKLKSEYFKDDCIEVDLFEDINNQQYKFDKDLHKALEIFSEYRHKKEEFHNELESIFAISFTKMSEGEKNLVDILSKINNSIKNAKEEGLILLLLDEPDTGLHPEWCRMFLDILIETISSFNYNIQAVITTHSPYMLSDIFPQNAYRFQRTNKDDNSLKIERLSEINNGQSSFGANIYDLISNSFFMNNSIGEFATKQINKLTQEISNINENTPEDEKERIKFLIENIGEPLLKNSLERKLQIKIAEISKITIDSTDTQYILELITDPNDKKKVEEFLKNRGEINHD